MCKYQNWFIQSKSPLNQRCSALKIQCFRAKNINAEQRGFRAVSLWNSAVQLWNSAEFFSSEQRWFREHQSWSALKQSWSALMFIMFSESALKNVKTMKQRCSALIISGTSTRVNRVNLDRWLNLEYTFSAVLCHLVRNKANNATIFQPGMLCMLWDEI